MLEIFKDLRTFEYDECKKEEKLASGLQSKQIDSSVAIDA